MKVKFLDLNDARVNEIGDFTVQVIKIQDDTDTVIDEYCHIDTSFKNLYLQIKAKYFLGADISVLDYGDELRAIITPVDENFKRSYTIIKHTDSKEVN